MVCISLEGMSLLKYLNSADELGRTNRQWDEEHEQTTELIIS